jgi:hypothetical protein
MAGFTVWVTGSEARTVEDVAAAVAARLQSRGLAVEVLDRRTPGIDAIRSDDAVTFVADVLARHDVIVVVALPAPAQAARDRARERLGRMIEVYVPGVPAPGYEPPAKAEVEAAGHDPAGGAERALRTLEILGFLEPSGTHTGFSDEEERAVIRRLKAFGYL